MATLRGRQSDHFNEPALALARRDYVSVLEGQSAGEALAHVQQGRPSGRIVYFYVVGEEDRL